MSRIGKKIIDVPEGVNVAISESEILTTGPKGCLLYTSPSPRDGLLSRMPSSA